MTTLLDVSGLSAGYGQVPVLHGIDLAVHQGEVVSVIGANGAGKSTLLLAITGHLTPTAGRITFADRPITGEPAHRIVAHGLAMVPEGGRLFPFMTVQENLELGAYHAKARPHRRTGFEEMTTLFPIIAARRRTLAGRLSGGERQMVAIARAMMSRPALLLLDEPSLGLSPLMVERVFALVRDLAATRHVSILLVEQNVGEALEMSHRGYVMERGHILKHGPGPSLRNDADIQRAYMGL